MILQALKEYYDRKEDLAPIGWVDQGIDYVVILEPGGTLVQVDCLQDFEKGKRIPFPSFVPSIGKQAMKHTNSGVDANLLWDKAEFALGVGNKGDKKLANFIETIQQWLGDVNDEGVSSVISFLQNGLANSKVFSPITMHQEYGEEISSGRPNITFRLAGDQNQFVFDRPAVKKAISERWRVLTESSGPGACLVTGREDDRVETCHMVTKGVWGAQTSGATIVGFNGSAFCSYGKDQGANAPVGKEAAFAYTTALNHLLGKDSKQRMQVGDSSTVFWSKSKTEFEQHVVDFFGEPPKDDPDRNVRAVEGLFKSVNTGVFPNTEETTQFYVLGLAPNASRIAIRFWIVDTVRGMSEKICQHFQDTKIIHGPRDKDALSLFRLLVSTASLGKADNIPPNLGGETMRAILEGRPYPQTLLQAAIRRIRAEHEVTYPRAALLKACLNRSIRCSVLNNERELAVSLDESNTNIGYRLGRLFSTLEKIQAEANPGINATIRDRFYGAASGTPVTVFANLMRLKNHHLAKLDSVGRRIFFEKLIGEIMDGIDDFPTHLGLGDQGHFAIGYYHQMQQFYTKKSDKSE